MTDAGGTEPPVMREGCVTPEKLSASCYVENRRSVLIALSASTTARDHSQSADFGLGFFRASRFLRPLTERAPRGRLQTGGADQRHLSNRAEHDHLDFFCCAHAAL